MIRHMMFSLLALLLFCFVSTASGCPALDRAIGQMMMVGFDGTAVTANSPVVAAIKNDHIGGVILFDHVHIDGKNIPRNIVSPQQLKQLTTTLQNYAKKYHDYPLLIAVNQEGGEINVLKKSKGFDVGANDSEQKLGAINNPALIYQQAYQRGILLKKYGINLDLAPVADLNINPSDPAIGALQRSFGKNVTQVINDLATTILAYHKAGILCTLKHFPGIGSAKSNTDFSRVDVTSTWQPDELLPYATLIRKNQACNIVMVTHVINRKLDRSGLPASLSKLIITGILRDKFHFNGVIITDDMDAKAIRDHYSMQKAIKLAVLAGNDIILYGGTLGHSPAEDTKNLHQILLQEAKNNKIFRKKVEIAATRIATLKNKIIR